MWGLLYDFESGHLHLHEVGGGYTEDGCTRQLRTAHVVVVEEAASGVPDRKEPCHRLVFRIEYLSTRVDEGAAERGRHTALERNGVEGSLHHEARILQGVGRRQLITRTVLNGFVVVVDDLDERFGIQTGAPVRS